MVSFLIDRNQYTRMGDNRSLTQVIIRSIVQCSGIGPTQFIIFICDLRPVELDNGLSKYAGDAPLLKRLMSRCPKNLIL